MNQENTFTSTGAKIIHHPEVIKKVIDGKYATPISLQIAPTSRCNLKCSFCSNANRETHEDLPITEIIDLLRELRRSGLKTVEWTGGGDPTLYEDIQEAIFAARTLGLKQGFITNGILLSKKITQSLLNKLWWVRISMNCLDYVDDIEIPEILGTLGFSYVMNDKTTVGTIVRLKQHVAKYHPAYVRIVPNCQATDEEQIENNLKYSKMIEDWGTPFFYQAKTFAAPQRCWWGYFKPFVLHDGNVFRCSSVVLNAGSDYTFHEKFKWCTIEELPDMYRSVMKEYTPIECNHCVFKGQNDLVDSLINKTGMEDFI